MAKRLEDYVVTIPDFPEPGIMFRDITSVIQDPEGLKMAVDGLAGLLKDTEYDVIVGLEARGFVFGAPIAYLQGKGIDGSRLKAIGYGFDHPKAPNDPKDGNLENRRVEVYIEGVKTGKVNYVNPGR